MCGRSLARPQDAMHPLICRHCIRLAIADPHGAARDQHINGRCRECLGLTAKQAAQEFHATPAASDGRSASIASSMVGCRCAIPPSRVRPDHMQRLRSWNVRGDISSLTQWSCAKITRRVSLLLSYVDICGFRNAKGVYRSEPKSTFSHRTGIFQGPSWNPRHRISMCRRFASVSFPCGIPPQRLQCSVS